MAPSVPTATWFGSAFAAPVLLLSSRRRGVPWRSRFHVEIYVANFRVAHSVISFVPWTGCGCGPARSRLLYSLWDARPLFSFGLCRNVQMRPPPVVQERKNAVKSDIEYGDIE